MALGGTGKCTNAEMYDESLIIILIQEKRRPRDVCMIHHREQKKHYPAAQVAGGGYHEGSNPTIVRSARLRHTVQHEIPRDCATVYIYLIQP